MLRRSLLVLAGLAVAAALAAPALAVDVHVRVEGLHTTIFGADEPLFAPFTGTLVAVDKSKHTLERPTALGALEAASRRGEFYYRLKVLSFGLFVDRIGRYPSAGASGWVFKVNGVSPPVGAAEAVLEDGDRVLWYFARFGEAGGPPTLDLVREGACVQAVAVDDKGEATRARDVVFALDGRRSRSRTGRICPTGPWSDLRATKRGAIASQVIHPR